MIGYNRLGSNGRLGNQMFQYAALRGIASYRGFDWVVPFPDNYGESNYGLFECFKMNSVEDKNFGLIPNNFPTYQSKDYTFDINFFTNCPDNCNLNDYFQSEKWFLNIEKTIRSDFSFKDEIFEPCKKMMDKIGDAISLHVRRTDYVQISDYHPLCSLDYYQKALNIFPKDLPVLIFSDDIEWCLQQKIFSDERFLISENQEKYLHLHKDADGQLRPSLIPYVDLCLQTLCKYNIIANSSFSWWGAWLNNNPEKKVVAPSKWFGPTANLNVKDLIPDSWSKI